MESEREESASAAEPAWRRCASWIAGHPRGLAQGVGLALLAIIVLQNVESTSLDVLFWTVSELPKLVVIFLAMIAGALVWEILRRTWLR
ncbi:MAG TPA: hypothetical protein VEC18_01295 [Myxococcota bacterium]|nr:hypothetical protein [Myxococcota bacterium]